MIPRSMPFPLMLEDRPVRYTGNPWDYIMVPRAFLIVDSDIPQSRRKRDPQCRLPKRLRAKATP